MILSTTEKQPTMKRGNGALVVGYLGFRAEIFPNRCTNCARKGRAAEPLSFPAATRLAKPMVRRTRPTLKEVPPESDWERPSAKNAVRARTT